MVGVQYRRRRSAATDRHGEGIFGELAIEIPAHGPAHNSTRIQIKNGCQIKPALARWNECDISQPTGVGAFRLEYPVQQVGLCLGVSRVGGDPEPPDRFRHDLCLTHQLGNRVAAALNALSG